MLRKKIPKAIFVVLPRQNRECKPAGNLHLNINCPLLLNVFLWQNAFMFSRVQCLSSVTNKAMNMCHSAVEYDVRW